MEASQAARQEETLMVVVWPHEKFHGIFWVELEDTSQRLATVNLTPGDKVYGEQLAVYDGVEYRIWTPYRSKLAAAITKGVGTVAIESGYNVLYLGAASGTTASHVSDIVGSRGVVFCVEFAPRVMRELVRLAEQRTNIVPVLADARQPQSYSSLVRPADFLYCDVAQPEQAKIVVDNAKLYLSQGKQFMIAIKARSVDVTKNPEEVYRSEIGVLRGAGALIRQTITLEPYDKDHAMVVGVWQG